MLQSLQLARYESNLLEPCWKAGASKNKNPRETGVGRNEIAAVDIVACCKQITDLIDENKLRINQARSLNTRTKGYVDFKIITRLTYGAAHIYRRQVDTLLDDAKHLLDQMNQTTFDFVLTTKETLVVKHQEGRTHHKRKHVITKQARMRLSKRPRLQEPELLDDDVLDHYGTLISNCQVWHTESSQEVMEESIELPRMVQEASLSSHLTITEEFSVYEEQITLKDNEGFGDNEQVDLTIFEELYPRDRQSLKRHSLSPNSTDILDAKIPRLDVGISPFGTTNAESAIVKDNNIPLAMPVYRQDVHEPALPQPPLSSPTDVPVPRKQSKKRGKQNKLIVDKFIKYSRDVLIKHRLQYLKEHRNRVITALSPSKLLKSAKILLLTLKNNFIFPDVLKKRQSQTLTIEQMDADCESTLRTILGGEYTDTLAQEVFGKLSNPCTAGKRGEIAVADPAIPLEGVENIAPPQLRPVNAASPSNNNNLYKHKKKSYEDGQFDSYDVMMDLLSTWRSHPELKGIDANEFLKTFPDRFKAVLAFSHLLCLVRDNFVNISKRPNSNEMDQITLGEQSIRLILNISMDE
ncbi:uncharacterized protein LOC117584665 [Drosophila guanche]|uniref:Rad21/Rec8-like protein N-terminal domain-containing protein n=1 Tax=Drosophila guanche TaxID=7266 RepID=A0A3B0JGF6_DROGU|nr:uncharacterized protein LOC117584665 [Drosophila guanche]SPP81474.1 Hypothetical predicted protein [Drosophila guanche]